MPGPAPSPLRGRVLVVDDDRSARLLLDKVLTKAGHFVSGVESAELALTHLVDGDFDLLVTDKNLPGMDGLEALRRARELFPRLRVVLMTGFPTPETRATAEAYGVYAYVTKPFGVHDILGICEGAIRASREQP